MSSTSNGECPHLSGDVADGALSRRMMSGRGAGSEGAGFFGSFAVDAASFYGAAPVVGDGSTGGGAGSDAAFRDFGSIK
jgi:hypothetical protein